MDMMSELRERAIDIVRQAGVLMSQSHFDVFEKEGCVNIVTSSDVTVQHFLCTELSALLPGCGFICEEEDLFDDSSDEIWIIDPIDGTANYARGIDHCAISLALRQAGETVLGIVYSPARDELYIAERGKGAWLNGHPIHVSARPFEDGILCAALSLYRKEYADACSAVIMDAYHSCNDVRRFGSAAIELCFLATGRCELFFEMRLQPWDYAAAALVLREAGGFVSTLDGMVEHYDAPDMIVAANSASSHARLLAIVRQHIPAIPYRD